MTTLQDPAVNMERLKDFTMSYFYQPGDSPMISLTTGQLVDQAADQWGSNEFLCDVHSGQRLTFGQLKEEVDQLASGLLQIGLKSGDRLGIWGPNSIRWIVTYLAASKAGLIAVPLNTQFEAPDLEFAMNHVTIKCLVIAEQVNGRNLFKILNQVVPELAGCTGNLGQTIRSTVVPSLTTVITMENQRPSSGIWLWREIQERGENRGSLENLQNLSAAVQFDDIATIIFTSGTTGRPKGVAISHHSIINAKKVLVDSLNYTSKDRLCFPVPFFSGYGIFLCPFGALLAGYSVVIPSPYYSPIVIIKAAAQERCTVIHGTPAMHMDMINSPGFEQLDLSSLKTACVGGAPWTPSFIADVLSRYKISRMQTAYGMSEVGVVLTSRKEDDASLARITVGYPVKNVEVKIVDKQGQIVSVGERGELCFRGASVTQGYWNDPDKTREVIDSARWFHTGDAAFFYPSGHLGFCGRFKDMLVRGGEQIFPKDVEDFLQDQPEIQEAHVFGVPDKQLGEVVAAWVLPKSGILLDAKTVKSMSTGKISQSKVPSFVKILQSKKEFPQTASGKVSKLLMLQKYARELGLTSG